MLAHLGSFFENILLREALCVFLELALTELWVKRFFILYRNIVKEEAKVSLFCLKIEMAHGRWYLVILFGSPENRDWINFGDCHRICYRKFRTSYFVKLRILGVRQLAAAFVTITHDGPKAAASCRTPRKSSPNRNILLKNGNCH